MAQSSSFATNAFDVPQEIQRLAEEEKLGELCKIYTVSKSTTNIFVVGVVFCIGGGILWTLLIAAALFSAKYPPPPEWIMPGLLLLIAGLYITFSRRIYAHWHIYLWQYGFLYEKRRLRQVFRWDQIESVQGGGRPHLFYYKVCRQDGYKVTITHAFPTAYELIDILFEQFVCQVAPPGIIITLPRSIRTFTYTTIDRQGISNQQEKLEWQEIQEFIIKDGTVTLFTKEVK